MNVLEYFLRIKGAQTLPDLAALFHQTKITIRTAFIHGKSAVELGPKLSELLLELLFIKVR